MAAMAATYLLPLSPGSDAAHCAMACHRGTGAASPSCCLAGAEVVLRACAPAQDAVPSAPACRMLAPLAAAALMPPSLEAHRVGEGSARPIFRPSEPADPVPLALS